MITSGLAIWSPIMGLVDFPGGSLYRLASDVDIDSTTTPTTPTTRSGALVTANNNVAEVSKLLLEPISQVSNIIFSNWIIIFYQIVFDRH
jgi:hypothetical protein